jgi:hypothetical protein
MNRSTRILFALTLLLAISAPASAAEALPPELNLIPRDAGMFVSFRVGDLWEDARLKPLRDFLAKDGSVLREFEKENGFKPEDVERVTLLIAGFDSRRGPGDPWIVVTFKKDYDLAKLLDAWHGMSPAEFRRFDDGRRFERVAPFPLKGGGFGPPPKFIEEKFPLPPKPIFKEDAPPKQFEEKLPGPKDFSPVFFAADDNPPAKKEIKRDLKAAYYVLREGSGFMIPINSRTVIICPHRGFGDNDSAHDLLAALLRRGDDGPLAPALETAAGKHSIVVGLNLRSLKDGLPDDKWIEVLPIQSLLASRCATVTLDLGDDIKLGLRVDAPDAATAKRVHDVLKAFHTLALETLPGLKKLAAEDDGSPVKILLMVAEPLLQDVAFEQKDTMVIAIAKMKGDATLAAAVTDAIEKVRYAAARVTSQHNLKQMGLAVHNYHDAMGRFPFPGISSPKGQPFGGLPAPNPNLSWRVAILPYIEQQNLYQQFHIDEPWDSEHNKKLIPLMPKVYSPLGGADAPKGHTFYRMFTGPGTFSAARSFNEITDGTSNTIMILEAGESVPWTKPDEMPLGEKLPKLGGHFMGKMNVVMGDGSVRTIDLKKIGDATLRAAITTNGGEILGDDW